MDGYNNGKELPVVELNGTNLPEITPMSEIIHDALREFSSVFHFEKVNNEGVNEEAVVEEVVNRLVAVVEAKDETAVDSKSEVEKKSEMAFSLMAKLHVPSDISADVLKSLLDDPATVHNIYDQDVSAPAEPVRPTTEKRDSLYRMMPIVTVDCPTVAHSDKLRDFCLNSPIVNIRGLAPTLGLDLSIFESDKLVALCPTIQVTTYTQAKVDEPPWKLDNIVDDKYSSIGPHANYQRKMARAEEEDKRRLANPAHVIMTKKRKLSPKKETVKFGSNIDLKDRAIFHSQINELDKLPVFCRVRDETNLLSHVDHEVFGVNTVQLYMKVKGNRTPGHMESNCMASININIGPGDCEWFGVPYEYMADIMALCVENGNIEFLDGGWWPASKDLIQAGIPLYRFTQKPGDLVWVGLGCLHWVQSHGWCNNVSYNVGPMTHSQLAVAVHRYELNREWGYKSLVPMMHLCWQIAKNVQVTDHKIYSLIRDILIRSIAYSKNLLDWVNDKKLEIYHEARESNDYTNYCDDCQCELFNILLSKKVRVKKVYVYKYWCIECLAKQQIKGFYVLQQLPMEKLFNIFSDFKLHDPTSSSQSLPQIL